MAFSCNRVKQPGVITQQLALPARPQHPLFVPMHSTPNNGCYACSSDILMRVAAEEWQVQCGGLAPYSLPLHQALVEGELEAAAVLVEAGHSLEVGRAVCFCGSDGGADGVGWGAHATRSCMVTVRLPGSDTAVGCSIAF
jgi:hypothetical protein